LIAYFLTNISAKYYDNPTMLSRGIAKNIGMFFETHCIIVKIYMLHYSGVLGEGESCFSPK